MTLCLLEQSVSSGARWRAACKLLGISLRTVHRWRAEGCGEDRRHWPNTPPANRLKAAERRRVLKFLSSPELCDLSPWQIVPRLADQGTDLASEATMCRILREAGQVTHKQRS